MVYIPSIRGTLSSNYVWYVQEKDKSDKGLDNELDIAEILAAMKGVKNRWHKVVKSNLELFRPILHDPTKYDWAALKEAQLLEKIF